MNRAVGIVLVAASLLLGGCHRGPAKDQLAQARVDYNTGAAYLRNGELQNALMSFKRAQSVVPDDARTMWGIGLVYYGLEDFETAAETFEAAIRLDPNIPEIHNNLGSTYLRLERYREAIQACETALADGAYRTPSAALFNIARAHLALGEHAEAEERLRRAIRIDPGFDQPYYELARLRMRARDYRQAEELLLKALQRNPSYFEAFYELAMARYALSDLAGAEKSIRNLLERLPQQHPLREDATRFLETMLGAEM